MHSDNVQERSLFRPITRSTPGPPRSPEGDGIRVALTERDKRDVPDDLWRRTRPAKLRSPDLERLELIVL